MSGRIWPEDSGFRNSSRYQNMVGVQEPIARLNQTPKRLLIVGASARSAAWSARQAGFEVDAIDLFGDQDLRVVADSVQVIPGANYPSGIPDLVHNAGPLDAWIYTGGLENYPRLVDQVSKHARLFGNDADVLRLVRDPKWLQATFQSAGIPFPQTFPIPPAPATPRKDLSKVAEFANKRWLHKPIRSAGGNRIEFADRSNLPSGPGTYLQEFLDGPTFSAVYLATPQPNETATVQLLGVTRLWTARDLANHQLANHQEVARNAFSYLGSTGPVDLADGQRKQWQAIGNCLVAKANLRGLFGVDAVLVDKNDQPTVCPIEVNPRYTASTEILERAMGSSLMAAHVNAFVELDAAPIPRPAKNYWGKRIRFAEKPIKFIKNFEEVFPHPSSIKSWILADIPQGGDVNHETNQFKVGEPILTTIAESLSLNDVERALGFPVRSDP